MKCVDWEIRSGGNEEANSFGSNVLYIGDSLFADLVDAKRQFGWTTAAVSTRSFCLYDNTIFHLFEHKGDSRSRMGA